MHRLTDGPISDEELESALSAEISDAVDWNDTTLAPARAAASLYYKAAPFGTEESGRSQIVMPVVRDTVRATLPSLMRIFFGGSRVVEFVPSARTASDLAEDATETVNYVFTRANPGYEICWAAFKDALVRRSGWIKWWFDSSTTVTSTVFDGVTEDQLVECLSDPEPDEHIEVLSRTEAEPTDDPETGQQVPQYLYKIQITKRTPANRVRVCAVPPDEVLMDRYARSVDEARIVIHRTMMTRSDLIAMGVPDEMLDNQSNFGPWTAGQDAEVSARQPGRGAPIARAAIWATADQSLIPHFECYWRVDRDGDGISELRKVMAVGQERKIWFDEPTDHVQLACFCPDPEPHVAVGLSQADSTMDLQLIESHVMRDMLDSLKASIFPRTSYVEGQVNVDDVLNTEIGAAIRCRAPGMFQTHEVPFAGREAYPLLEHLQNVREQRTGIGRAAMGLDGSALQSTTAVAAAASVTAAQSQVELIARIFAESGMKRVFRGILRLLTRHQNVDMQIHLNGRTLEVSPCEWDPDMEVSVNTALGSGTNEAKLAMLSGVAAQQKEILLQLGASNPLCTLKNFYNTQVRMLELSGFRDAHRFFTDPDTSENEIDDPQPSPEQVLAQAQIAIEQSKHELEALKAILQDDRERDKNEADIILRATEIAARYNTTVDMAALSAAVEHSRDIANKSHDMSLAQMKAAQEAEAIRSAQPQSVVNFTPPEPKPRKVIKTPIRDESGRIVSIHEEEIP